MKTEKKFAFIKSGFVLACILMAGIVICEATAARSKWSLSRFAGIAIEPDSIVGFVDSSTLKDFAGAWLLHCDACFAEKFISKSVQGYSDQTLFAKKEAKRLFGYSPDSFESTVYISSYGHRYEVWFLFDKERKTAFAMVF